MAGIPVAYDIKPFVPAKDFDFSLRFYQALGFQLNWRHDKLAELELATSRIFLQDFYVKDWAENTMLYIPVESADEWWAHAETVLRDQEWRPARARPPVDEPYGARVTYVWDPAGVLLHFAQSGS